MLHAFQNMIDELDDINKNITEELSRIGDVIKIVNTQKENLENQYANNESVKKKISDIIGE